MNVFILLYQDFFFNAFESDKQQRFGCEKTYLPNHHMKIINIDKIINIPNDSSLCASSVSRSSLTLGIFASNFLSVAAQLFRFMSFWC